MKMQPSTHLDLSDLYVAAYLVSQGAQLEGTERAPDGRVHFHLRRMEGMEDLLQMYWQNTPVPIVPAQLFSALRYLKSLLHSKP